MAYGRYIVFLLCSFFSTGMAQSYGEYWYDNPLGFSPVNLHTKNGFLIPALAVGLGTLLTDRETDGPHQSEWFMESGVSWGYKYPRTTLSQTNIGVLMFLRQWMAVGVDAGMYVPRDAFNRTIGIAIRPFARFYAIHNGSTRLYFESGGGFINFTETFPQRTDRDPRLGTPWDGTTRYGIGAETAITPTVRLLLAVRHVHVSNGNTSGVERNPSHDSNGFSLGVSFDR